MTVIQAKKNKKKQTKKQNGPRGGYTRSVLGRERERQRERDKQIDRQTCGLPKVMGKSNSKLKPEVLEELTRKTYCEYHLAFAM